MLLPFITSVFSAILVAAVLHLLRRSEKLHFDSTSISPVERLRILSSYGKVECTVSVALVCVVVLLVWLFYEGFTALHDWTNPAVKGVGFSLRADPRVWLLPSLGLGFLAPVPVAYALLRCWLGDRYTEYKKYEGLRYGFDSRRVLLLISAALMPLVALFFHFASQCKYDFSDSGISLRSFFSLSEREYAYREVVRLLEELSFKAPAGNIVRKPRYTILFSDGGKWSTQWTLAALDGIDARKLMLFVSRNSAVPIETVDPFPE